MYKKRAIPTPNNIEYDKCMEKIRANHPSRAHLFEDICRIASGIIPRTSPTAAYKFMDLWFNDPSVVESVLSAMRSPNLCFLHPIFIKDDGTAIVHRHLGRNNYVEQTLVPSEYKTTEIDSCAASHMAIPLMFNKHANILLISTNDGQITVEHFEPHGPVHDPPSMPAYNIETVAKNLASELLNVPLAQIYYMPPSAVCFPHWTGPQSHVATSTFWNNTCTIWSMLYAFKRLLSPQTPPNTTYDEIKSFAKSMENNDDLIKATVEAFMKLVDVNESKYTVNIDKRFIPEVRRNISNAARKRKGGTKQINRKQLLIIFDIDETLIQYIPSKYHHLWMKKKHLFPKNSFIEIAKKNGTKDVVIFRPHLQQMFNYLVANRETIKIAIWTYSERDYAHSIATTLIARYQLPNDIFLFLKGAEDINDDDDYPKNLQTVYQEYPEYNVFNTILVDDRYTNIQHKINVNNGLLIEQFAPFGKEKERVLLDNATIQNMVNNDRVMLDAIRIFDAVHKDIMGCDEADIDEGFTEEPVFSSRIFRMGLDSYLQSYAIKPVRINNIISIGTPYMTNNFLLLKSRFDVNSMNASEKQSKRRTGSKRPTSSKRQTRRTI